MASCVDVSDRVSWRRWMIRPSVRVTVAVAAVLVAAFMLIWPAAALAVDLSPVRYDHKDTHIAYSGVWGEYPKTAAWTGGYNRSSTSGASVTIAFEGTRLDWIAMKGTTTGIGDVYLDGEKKASINLANPTAVYQQNVWSTGTLEHKLHVVTIVRSDSSAVGKYLTIDAVDVVGTLVTPPAPPPSVTSLTFSSGPAVGGTTVIIRGSGFTGLSGEAAVSFGDAPATSYTVNSATQITAVAPAHDLGVVDVKVSGATGTSLSTAASKYTFMTRHDHTDVSLGWSGTWGDFFRTAAWQGSYARSSTSGASVTITFDGTRLDWIAMKGTSTAIGDVYLDGVKKATINLASAAAVYQQKVWSTGDLEDKQHVVKIVRSAASASGKYLTIDAVDVVGTLVDTVSRYEQGDSRILYTSPTRWVTTSVPGASGGSDIRTNVSWISMTVVFTGRRLDWIATKGPEMGGAVISLDGGEPQLVNLYSDVAVYQQKVWSTGTLESGTHWAEIRWNLDNVSGKYINIDAFDVVGYLPSAGSLTSTEIKWAEQRLADLSYRSGVIDGHADSRTETAVVAFEKWEGLPRDGVLGPLVWERLKTATRPTPKMSGASNPWIEVDTAKQVLLYCKDGAVVWTLEVSTGSASVGIVSPPGTWTIFNKRTDSPGGMYKPMYYYQDETNYLAIHGYPNVPTYPASHGCVRTQYWDQDALYPLIELGTYVYIY